MHRKQLPIASSCGEDWDAMRGDEQRRHCERCAHDVVNLSAMTEPEARALFASRPKAATLCVRYRSDSGGRVQFRPDGSGRSDARLARRAPSLAAAGLASMLACAAPALADTSPPEPPHATAPDGTPAPKPSKPPKPKKPKKPLRERDDMGLLLPY
jgi:hypothetical protein